MQCVPALEIETNRARQCVLALEIETNRAMRCVPALEIEASGAMYFVEAVAIEVSGAIRLDPTRADAAFVSGGYGATRTRCKVAPDRSLGGKRAEAALLGCRRW